MRKNNILFFVAVLSMFLVACGGKKSDVLIKDWVATELTLGETVLSAADLGGINFSFKSDSSFVYTESGSSESGKWSMNEEGNSIQLTYTNGNRVVAQEVKELTAEKLVLKYEEHGMGRQMTLVPATK